MNVTQRLDEHIAIMGVPPRGSQIPSLEVDVNDNQASSILIL